MIFATMLCFLLGYFFSDFFLAFTDFSGGLHVACLKFAPQSDHQKIYQALVCAHPISNHPVHGIFKNLGAIHLLVVSGAHLHILKKITNTISYRPLKPWIEHFVLLIFSSACQWSAPLLRAYIFVIFKQVNKKFYLYIPSYHLLILSVILTLGLDPKLWQSLSLPLSWLACLGLTMGRSSLDRAFWVFLFIFPVLKILGAPSFLTILVNAYITPVLGYVMFPLSLMGFLFHFITPLSDQLWSVCLLALSHIQQHLNSSPASSTQIKPLAIWCYCLVIQTLVAHFQKRPKPCAHSY